ncbi:MAG: peptidoglycan DD-metalloendopeptidase family protein [Clostridia bacterium]|nr:peptidoglycan DD-metalloendopeptidase family protein [Clostridia bacterium]
MKSKIFKILAVLVCMVMVFTATEFAVIDTFAASYSQLEDELAQKQAELKKLQAEKASQQKIKAALDSQIYTLQQQIDLCNSEIKKYNASIAQNEKLIAEKNAEISDSIDAFRKRIRNIYMSGSTAGGLEILLGAESFSDFLVLSEYTSNMSRRDKKLIEKLEETIVEIEKITEQNESMIAKQNEIRKTLNSKQQELDTQVSKVNKIISGLSSDAAAAQKDIAAIKKEMQEALKPSTGGNQIFADGQFIWPVPGNFGISSYYGSRWGSSHKGIDISNGGIKGKAVVATANGTVYIAKSGCTHNYGKSGSCGCGGGYGNYVAIDHGSYNGTNYRTLYGHMGSITVRNGQQVKKGQVIGYVGSTGWSTGWHLHYEIIQNYVRVDPMKFYSKVK